MLTRICFVLLTLLPILACHNTQKMTAGAHYTEPHRPQFHFSPPAKWMNDPNGMVYYQGEYHLFYQYYPDSTVWGPMHWGHAVSRDLVHWAHLPIALYPDSLGYIFSGSVVVDWKNTSGFGQGSQPPLVAVFTHHLMAGEKAGRNDFQYQSIAYSNDRGRSWTKYTGNPVIPNPGIRDFRDTKVIWDEARQRWLLVLAAQDHVQFWSSPDLKNWTHRSDFGSGLGGHGGVWECPDLFPLTVAGSGEQKWVLLQSLNPGSPNGGSGTQYFIGDFDGTTFTLERSFAQALTQEKALWLDWGRDNYAGVTWSDIPKADGRRLFIGWMSNWDYAQVVPTQTWRSATTLPRVLVLKNTPAGLRVFSQPVKELEQLRQNTYTWDQPTLTGEVDITNQLKFSPATSEVVLEMEIPEGEKPDVGIMLSNSRSETYRVGFDAVKNEFYSDRTQAGSTNFSKVFATKRHSAPRRLSGKTVQLHVFFDVASCELFADDGAATMTDIFFPQEDFNRMKIYASGGTVAVKTGKIYHLKSIWR